MVIDSAVGIALAMKYKTEIIATALLCFQGWMGKTDKIKACNYLDLAIGVLTYIRDFFKKETTEKK